MKLLTLKNLQCLIAYSKISVSKDILQPDMAFLNSTYSHTLSINICLMLSTVTQNYEYVHTSSICVVDGANGSSNGNHPKKGDGKLWRIGQDKGHYISLGCVKAG